METGHVSIKQFSSLFCFSAFCFLVYPPSPHLLPLLCIFLAVYVGFAFFFYLPLSFFLPSFLASFSTPPLIFLYPVLSSSVTPRSQWVWLRGECGAPPLSLAIKAMPTPRLHMSSRPSKRGGVLLIRSVWRSANTLHATSVHVSAHVLAACMFFFLFKLFFGCLCVIGQKMSTIPPSLTHIIGPTKECIKAF